MVNEAVKTRMIQYVAFAISIVVSYWAMPVQQVRLTEKPVPLPAYTTELKVGTFLTKGTIIDLDTVQAEGSHITADCEDVYGRKRGSKVLVELAYDGFELECRERTK